MNNASFLKEEVTGYQYFSYTKDHAEKL